MKLFLKIVLGLIVVAVLVLGYWGFVPGLSNILGSNKARDLGVRPTEEAYVSAQKKTGITFKTLPAASTPQESLQFSGKTTIKAELTDEELTSLLAHDVWKYNPIKDGQIKIHPDGTAEVSGVLVVDRIEGYLAAHSIPYQVVAPYLETIASLGVNPAFDIQLNAGWQNNTLSMDVKRLEVGRFSIPEAPLKENKKLIEAAVQSFVLGVPGTSFRSVTFTDGAMKADGTFPSAVSWVKE